MSAVLSVRAIMRMEMPAMGNYLLLVFFICK